MTAHRIVLLLAAIAALAVAALFGAPRIAVATQSMFAVAAFGFATGLVLAFAGERVMPIGRRAVDDGFVEDAVKRYPIAHLLLAVIAIVGLAIYFVSIVDPARYDLAFFGGWSLGAIMFSFYAAAAHYRKEQFDD